MSIQNLNLLAHASAALMPSLTRTGSIPGLINLVTSMLPTVSFASAAIFALIERGSYAYSHQSSNYEDSRFYAKIAWYLLPECLAIGTILSTRLGILGRFLGDAGAFAAGAIGSFRSLNIGVTGRDRTLDIPYTSPALRAVFSVIGITGLAQVADAIKNIAIGLFALQSLDPEQRYFVLKHRSIETLGGPVKSCRAVIIDGMSSEWGGSKDDYSWPLAEEIYRHCEVRTYRVDLNSTVPVCDAAEKGKEALGDPLDILALLGHGDEIGMTLNEYIDFRGSSDETACLKDHLQPDAQMILAGCNTATGNNSLTEKVSRHLNGIEVTGFSAYSNPDIGTNTRDGKKLKLWSYFPIDSQGNWIFPWSNTARSFKILPSNEPQDVFRGHDYFERGP
jgi:hypothetical protein